MERDRNRVGREREIEIELVERERGIGLVRGIFITQYAFIHGW